MEKLEHQGQVDHGSFIHDHYIGDQLMVRVVEKIGRIRNSAQQPVNRGRVGRQQYFDFIRTIECGLRILDGLFQARSRFAAWRRKSNAKTLIASLFQQER